MTGLQSELNQDIVLNGRYRLKDRIGIGGMSVVYKAMDLDAGVIVAVKVLKEEYRNDQDFVKKFLHEVKATQGLSHRNIVQVYDQGQDGDVPYIVEEYIEGVTLKDYINALQTIKWKDALNITAQVLSAVDCAHSHNVIHRDIKPQNIMITDQGLIKLTDFGIATAVSSSTRMVAADSAGSVHYLSPEQARGGFVDERSDIYSIGISLYEMVTGVVPFDGDSHVSIALKHIDGNIVPPHTVDPDIPYGVSDLVLMAAKKNPAERFQSAREMYSRLKMVMENPGFSFLNPEEHDDYDLQNLDPTAFAVPVINTAKTASKGTGTESSDVSGQPKEVVYNDIDRAAIVRQVTLTTLAYVLAIVLGIVGVVFMVTRFRSLNKNMKSFTTYKFPVSDYTGMNAEAVVSALDLKGVKVIQVPVESDDYPAGYIVGQNLKNGTLIGEKDEIKLQISSQSGSITLDDYSGKDYRDVEARLVSLLGREYVKVQTVSSSKFDEYIVVRTSPAANTIIAPETVVTIYYSSGQMSEKVRVPDVRGMSLEEAMRAIELMGLHLGPIDPQPEEDITEYLEMLKKNGTIVPKATPTPEPTEEPTAEPTEEPTEVPSEENTEDPGDEGDATPEPTEEPTSEPTEEPTAEPTGTPEPTATPAPVITSIGVVDQYPAAGTELYKGETVYIYFYDMDALAIKTVKEFERPDDITEDTVSVLIESRPLTESTVRATELFNEVVDVREDFPIQYVVKFPVYGEPQRVYIYIDKQLYSETIMYE